MCIHGVGIGILVFFCDNWRKRKQWYGVFVLLIKLQSQFQCIAVHMHPSILALRLLPESIWVRLFCAFIR